MSRGFGGVRRTARNPWRNGRYRDKTMSEQEADERQQRLRRTALHGARTDVASALMTGCAYHTR
jgi:hypothetical protein